MTKGISIIETVVVTTIIAVLSLTVLDIYLSANRLNETAVSRSQIQNQSQVALSLIRKTTEAANRILANQTINGTARVSDGHNLVLRLPAFDPAGNPLPGVDYASIYVEGKKLYLEFEPAVNSRRPIGKKLLTDQLEEISFKYFNPVPAAAEAINLRLKLQTTGIIKNQTEIGTVIILKNYEP